MTAATTGREKVGSQSGGTARVSLTQLSKQIADCFQKDIKHNSLGPEYRFGMAAVAILILALPLIYIALIGLLAYAVYYHAVEDTGILTSGSGGMRARLVAYVAPLLMGLFMLAFMLKPFFAPRANRSVGPTISEEEEPLVHQFITLLCLKLGAPVPKRIDVISDVNASASFRRGWLSFFGRDLVLTIGMPLVAGLTVRQLAGIIAHEFGHFRQGGGMRLTYIVGTINNWFARVVYQRDSWDVLLYQGSHCGNGLVIVFCYILRLFVWLTRRLLWLLMVGAHILSSYMSREMEYDADSAFASVAGSEYVGSTLAEISILAMLQDHALEGMHDKLGDGKLYDDLPQYTFTSLRLLSAEHRRDISKSMKEMKTGIFDTHPSLMDRDENARDLNQQAVMDIDVPARHLFRNFDRLCKAVTYAWYREIIDEDLEKFQIVSTEPYIAELKKTSKHLELLEDYLGDAYTRFELPSVTLKPVEQPKDARDTLRQLKDVRTKYFKHTKTMRALREKIDELEWQYRAGQVVSRMLNCGLKSLPGGVDKSWKKPGVALEKSGEAIQEIEKIKEQLDICDKLVSRRLLLAMRLLFVPKVAARVKDAAIKQARVNMLVPVINQISEASSRCDPILRLRDVLLAMPTHIESVSSPEEMIVQCKQMVSALRNNVRSFSESAKSIVYPEDTHADQKQEIELDDENCYDLNMTELPVEDEEGLDFSKLREVHEMQFRAICELVTIALEVEAQLTLTDAPKPPQPAVA